MVGVWGRCSVSLHPQGPRRTRCRLRGRAHASHPALPGCLAAWLSVPVRAFERELKQNWGSSHGNETKNLVFMEDFKTSPPPRWPQPFHSCCEAPVGWHPLPRSHRPRPETLGAWAFVLTRSWVVPTLAAAQRTLEHSSLSPPLLEDSTLRAVSSREIN